MLVPRTLVLASLVVLTLPAFAEEKTLPDRIADNVQNLGHARFAVRETATRDLVAIGEPALKLLKSAAAGKDEEIRRRAEAVVRLIEASIQNKALIRAPKLHLKYDGKPLDEAIADFAQKTGQPFILDPKSTKNAKQAITLDTGNVPYWEAVEKFLAATGLTEGADVNPNPQPAQPNWGSFRGGRMRRGAEAKPDNRIRLVDSKSALASATDTLIRIKALPIGAPATGVVKGSNEINFSLDVMPSPTLTWQGLVGIDVRKAIDDRGVELAQSHVRGNSMQTYNEQLMMQNGIFIQGQGQVIVNGNAITWSGEEAPNQIGNPRQLPITLLGKDSPSKSLAELRGIVTARVLTPPQALLTVDNVMTAPTKETFENGDYRVKIVERKLDKKGYAQVRFQLVSPVEINNVWFGGGFNPGLMQLEEVAPGQPAIAFQDAAGKNITNVSVNVVEQNFNGEAQTTDYLAVFRSGTPDAVKLVLNGRKSVCVDVPFVLKNVPLP